MTRLIRPLRLAVIADDDNIVLPSTSYHVDVLLSLGDVHPFTVERVANFFMPDRILAVSGNHDSPYTHWPHWVEHVHGRIVEAFGLRFGGLDGCWRYKKTGAFLFTQEEARSVMQSMPPADVLISHNSPAGYHERDRVTHQGFESLTEYVDRYAPALLLHGHQHLDVQTRRKGTLIAGVWGLRLFELSCERAFKLNVTQLASSKVY